jgi:tetratricopeptide (TPR) repeat protein
MRQTVSNQDATFLMRPCVANIVCRHKKRLFLSGVLGMLLVCMGLLEPTYRVYAEANTATMERTLLVLHEQLEVLSQENYRLKEQLRLLQEASPQSAPQSAQMSGGALPESSQTTLTNLQRKLDQASLKLREAIETINQQNGYITSLSERLERLQSLNDQKASQSLEPVSLMPQASTPLTAPLETYYAQVTQGMQAAQQALDTPNIDAILNALQPLVYVSGTKSVHPQAFPLAVLWYARALALKATSPTALAQTHQPTLEEAQTLLNTLMQQAPYMASALDVQELQAWQKLAQKQPQQAVEAFGKVFSKPSMIRFAKALEGYQPQDSLQASYAVYVLLTQLYPKDAYVWYQRGVVAMNQQFEQDAIQAFEQVLNLPDTNPKTHYYLGLLYARRAIQTRKQVVAQANTPSSTVSQAIQQDVLKAVEHLEKTTEKMAIPKAPPSKTMPPHNISSSLTLSPQEHQMLTYWLTQLKTLK